jgi:hypothetical protein
MSNLHQKIMTQNLGNFPSKQQNKENKNVIMRKAADSIKSNEYLKNWFGADGYFGTEYVTGILKGAYFVTCDHWMSSLIYSVKFIKDDCIETLLNNEGDRVLTSLQEAKALIDTHVRGQL